MRIVHVNSDSGVRPGSAKGAAVHVEAMRAAFRELGHEVVAVDGAVESQPTPAAVDLVYERYALGAELGASLARRTQAPHVLEVNAPLLEEARLHRPDKVPAGAAEAERRLFSGADLVCAVSTAVADYAERGGCPRSRILVRGNAFDPLRFRPRAADAGKDALGLPDSAFVVGFHGRLRPWHGFDRIVAATARLARASPDVHLATLGRGDFADEVRRHGLEERWVHHEWVDHARVGELVACFDVLPLAYEAGASCYFSPLKLTEAMACGVVPVVPALGDLTEMVQDGASGLVYDPLDPGGLPSALERLLGDGPLRERLARGAQTAVEGRTWQALAAELVERVAGRESVP